jgi:hypothetical protein
LEQQVATQETSIRATSITPELISTQKAYVFIEPQLKTGLIAKYLKDTAKTQNFYGFWVGLGLKESNKTDLIKYVDMPYWYNGNLPNIVETEVPQTSGGIDLYGKSILAYNFKTFKIAKNTINDWAYVTLLIPTSAMANDTKQQKTVECFYSVNGVIKTSQNFQVTGGASYSLIINYTGTRIPKGNYRVVQTWPGTYMRVKLNTTDDVFFRGYSN